MASKAWAKFGWLGKAWLVGQGLVRWAMRDTDRLGKVLVAICKARFGWLGKVRLVGQMDLVRQNIQNGWMGMHGF